MDSRHCFFPSTYRFAARDVYFWVCIVTVELHSWFVASRGEDPDGYSRIIHRTQLRP
jgi:hypothetical protein